MFQSHLGELAALATAGCWTVTSMSFEAAGKRIGSLSVNLIRLVMALLFLSLTCWATIGAPYPAGASAHAWTWLAISGVIGFTIGDLCLFRAFVLVGARTGMLLMSLVPPVTALIGYLLLGELLAPLDWVGMGLTVGGVSWVVSERRRGQTGEAQGRPVAGILLGLGGACGQAVGLVLSKYGMEDYDPVAANLIRVYAGTLGFALIFTAIRGWPRVLAALKNRPAMLRVTLGAVFGPFLGVSLSLYAVQLTETGVASTIMSVVPVLIIPPAILVFKEKVSVRAFAGAVAAVGGVALLFL